MNSFPNEDRITSLLDCINRPFDFHPDGRVPDGNPNSTIQLVDYYDDNGVVTPYLDPSNGQPETIDGLGVMYCYGRNEVRSNSADITTCTTRSAQMYGPIYFFVGSGGQILSVAAYDVNIPATIISSPFWTNDPVNMAEIVGTNNNYDYNSALTNALRILSAGVRFWPTIELITDSTTLAVSRFYGAQMTAASLLNSYSDADNIYSVLRNSPSYYEFTNSQGVSGRFAPQQQGSVIQPLHLNSLAVIANVNMDTSGMYFPVLIARLTQQIEWELDAQVAFPVRSFFRTIMESSLTQPTPLQATRVPYVSDWDDKVHHFLYRNDLFPSIVAGHSFKKVMKEVVATLGKGAEVKRAMTEVKGLLNNLKSTYNATKSIAAPIVQAAKKKRKKKKKNGNGNGNNKAVNKEHDAVVLHESQRQDTSNTVRGDLVKLLNQAYA